MGWVVVCCATSFWVGVGVWVSGGGAGRRKAGMASRSSGAGRDREEGKKNAEGEGEGGGMDWEMFGRQVGWPSFGVWFIMAVWLVRYFSFSSALLCAGLAL
jgi:hypothetical protein